VLTKALPFNKRLSDV